MSTTNELRRLLDERGVEWKEYKFNPWTDTTAWDIDTSDPRYGVEAGFEEFDDGVTLLRFWNATPEQAIAATLGSGTCHKLPSSGETRCFVSRNGCEKEFGYWKCSNCGTECFEGAKYCMNCGAKAVDE